MATLSREPHASGRVQVVHEAGRVIGARLIGGEVTKVAHPLIVFADRRGASEFLC